jgi:thiamine-phosphate pyrophosphorylase
MAEDCLLYYITDRTALAGDESTRRRRLLEKITEAARANVDYIQLREKDLSTRDLEFLAREAVAVIQRMRHEDRQLKTRLLINSRTDVAMAVGADGVHLRSDDITPREVREIWKRGAGEMRGLEPEIAVSCHSPEEVQRAASQKATFAVLAPIFEKKNAPGVVAAGLSKLRQACQTRIPVFALGGVTLENARECRDAGVAGIAAIRLFQENEMAQVVKALR